MRNLNELAEAARARHFRNLTGIMVGIRTTDQGRLHEIFSFWDEGRPKALKTLEVARAKHSRLKGLSDEEAKREDRIRFEAAKLQMLYDFSMSSSIKLLNRRADWR